MQNLKRRIEQLEGLALDGELAGLTDEQLDARIAAFGLRLETPQELAACIAKLKADLSTELEKNHAKP